LLGRRLTALEQLEDRFGPLSAKTKAAINRMSE
jgi:hypothetical protein